MRRFWKKLFSRRRLEQDLEDELAFHREMSGSGSIPFGNLGVIKEQAFDLWRFTTIENLWRDIRYGVRGLKKHPSLVATAVLSLALGIGANTAIFSLGVEFLLSEPSVADGNSLVHIQFNRNSHADSEEFALTRESKLFAGVAGENEVMLMNWNNGVETRQVFSDITSKNFFTLLGIPVALGRGFAETDPDQVAVLHHHFWMQRFNGDPAIVGKTIMLDGRPYTILGVLPANFRSLIGYGFAPDIFVPVFQPDTYLALYGRLLPGVGLEQARAAAQSIAVRRLGTQAASKRARHPEAEVEPVVGFARLRNEQIKTVGLFFAILLVLAGLVLFIACANVASLLLARASTRTREMAVRLSLGASRGRLMQQLLAESLILSSVGAGCGLLLAWWINRALAQFNAPAPIPIRLTAEIDWRVALYAATLSITATVACGFIPAWQAARESFMHDSRSTGRMFLRRAIVVCQVAVSMVVLSTGILFVRNLMRSSALSPGFDVQHTVLAAINLPRAQYKDAKKIALYAERAVQELKALPGVQSAAAARTIPFTDALRSVTDLRFNGSDGPVRALFNWNAITADYFEALSIPMLAGRTFQATDAAAAERNVIVNPAFVREYAKCPVADAVGRTFVWGDNKAQVYQITGVAASTKVMTIGEEEVPQMYQYLPRMDDAREQLRFVVKSALPPAAVVKEVHDALRRIEPDAGIDAKTLFASIGFAFLPSQIGAAVLGTMGLLGLLLSMIGLFGVMAYSVARRTQEIGVRIAVGAPMASILRLVLEDAGRIVVLGSGIGIAVALTATRPLGSFLIAGLPPHDPITFVAALAVFTVTGAVASWGPAWRATRVDPLTCLRQE